MKYFFPKNTLLYAVYVDNISVRGQEIDPTMSRKEDNFYYADRDVTFDSKDKGVRDHFIFYKGVLNHKNFFRIRTLHNNTIISYRVYKKDLIQI